MTVRILRARTSCAPVTLLQRLGDHEDFPTHAPDVLSVTPCGEGHTSWQLAFRTATVHWVQQEKMETGGLTFQQTTGDFIALNGAWKVVPDAPRGSSSPHGSEVTYEVSFRTSVAHLAGAIDPVIGRVLLRSAFAILTGLAAPTELLSGGEYLHDLPPAA